jgi:hypothetical protein
MSYGAMRRPISVVLDSRGVDALEMNSGRPATL